MPQSRKARNSFSTNRGTERSRSCCLARNVSSCSPTTLYSTVVSGFRGRYAMPIATKTSHQASAHAMHDLASSATCVGSDWINPCRQRRHSRGCRVVTDSYPLGPGLEEAARVKRRFRNEPLLVSVWQLHQSLPGSPRLGILPLAPIGSSDYRENAWTGRHLER